MKQGTGLKLSASAISLLFVGSICYVLRDKKRSRLANELLVELKNRFNPSSLGLVNEKAFDVTYRQRVLDSIQGQVLVIKQSRAIQIAKQLQDAWKPWYLGGDNEDRIYSVFRALEDKVQVSQVADAYQKEFGVNLIDKIIARMDSEEISVLLRIVRTLPDYRAI